MRTSKTHTRKPNATQETITSASGISKPAIRPFHPVKAGNQPVVQRYTEEDGAKVSENREFAVKKEGAPDSELYVKDGIQPRDLDVATFTPGAASEDHPYGMKKVEKEVSMSPERIASIHCDRFSEKATGITENVQNGTAPPGRSLFTELTWGIPPKNSEKQEQRSNWGTHYAPVILADGGDRGTFETAVNVDHAWFGIYGQARGQTFRIKTVIADIHLAMSNGKLDAETGEKLLIAVDEYIRTGERTVENDEYLQKELNAIAEMEGTNPDIDEKFKKEKAQQDVDQQWKMETWELFKTGETATAWNAVKNENVSYLRGVLNDFEQMAIREGREDIIPKINRCKELNEERAVTKKKTGMSTTSKVAIGTTILAAGALIVWLLARKKK